MTGSAIAPGVIADAVAAAKGWLRLAGGEEDALLASLARTAIDLAEAFCGQALVARGFEDVIAPASAWQRLDAQPVTAIQGVTALPAGGGPFVLPAEAYAVNIDAEGRGWVRATAPMTGPVAASRLAVAYSAGLASDWAALPAPIAQGLAMLIGHLFDHRDSDAAPPAAVAALWRPWRRLRLHEEMRA